MVARVRISPAGAKVSMPGFNVDAAGDAQCLLNAGKYPIQIMQAGIVTIPGSGSVAILFGYELGYVPAAYFQSSDGSTITGPARADDGWGASSLQLQPVRRSREGYRMVLSCADTSPRVASYIIFRRPG